MVSIVYSNKILLSIRFILIFSLIAAGLTAGVLSQSVVTRTRTSTTLETIGSTIITTTVVIEGGEKTITMVVPGYVVVEVRLESGRTCVVIFRALREIPEQTVTITGGTFKFPGTTMSTVIREQTIIFSTAYTDAGWTTTYTGLGPGYVTTMRIGGMEYTFSYPVGGEFRERCGENIVSVLNTVIFETAPATFYLAFPGYTFTIPAATYTIPGITLEIEPFTTTYTSVIKGVTETQTTTFRGSTMIETITLQASTYVTTVVKEGSTVTRLVYLVETVTLGEETTTPATTTTPTTTVTTQPATTTPQVTRTETQPQPAQFDVVIVAIVLAVVAVVAGAVVYILKKKP